MHKALLFIAAVAAYTAFGMVTYGSTVDRVQNACIESPAYAPHVALWPASFAASFGLKSEC